MHDEQTLKWYDRMGVGRPSSDSHGTLEDIRANMSHAKVSKWWMEGNALHAESDMGPFVQYLPTDVVMDGVDKDGNPTFRKIG